MIGEKTLALTLTPLDVAFFRDGRAFGPGDQASGDFPAPQTLAGALRSLVMNSLGCDFEEFSRSTRYGSSFSEALDAQGPGLASVASMRLKGVWLYQNGLIYYRCPAILHQRKDAPKEFVLMKPLLETLPGWPPAFSSEILGIPLWVNCEGDSKPVGGWISQAGLTKIASGQVPDLEDIKNDTDLYGYEKRTGIKVDRGTKTAADTMIYSAKFLRLESDVSFFAIVEGVSEEVARVLESAKVIRWGGESRQFAMEAEIRRETPVSEPRQAAVGAGWALAILTSPAFLASGWQSTPGGPKAIASGKPLAISGWDMARACPKNTRFAWPAGTTLFFDQGDYDKLRDDFFGSPEDMSLGYGSFIEGHWDYE